MTTLRWIGKTINDDKVVERRFDLEHDTGVVPGILWTPVKQEHPIPLVLLGHGGSGHKRADRQLFLARRFARESQIAVAAIDGPFHGDRVPMPLENSQYLEMMSAIGIDKVVDGMIRDWWATLNALSELDTINTDRIAYIGLSLGTRFGLPLVAATGNRLRCAVFGKNGMRAPEMLNMAPRFAQDAPKVTVPTLFHMQWDDELFSREGQFELFDLLGTQDKRLIAFPGSHTTTSPAAVKTWCDFTIDYLASDEGKG